METKTYQTVKEFFKFLNDYEGEIWIRGSKAFDVNGELVAEYNHRDGFCLYRVLCACSFLFSSIEARTLFNLIF